MDGVLGKTISGGGKVKKTNDKMKSKSKTTDTKKKPVVKQNKKDKK